MLHSRTIKSSRPLSRGGHFESQGNKKLCFCPSSLALDERLDGQNLLFQHCVIKVYRATHFVRSERKRVSYDVLHKCSSVDILFAENRKNKRSQVKYMGLYVSVFSKQKSFRHFYFVLALQTLIFPHEFTIKPGLYY